MAPKTTPKTDKLALIHRYLLSSGTCHTLKDLEKTLPAMASIPSMQVKEYVQSLADEGQLRVEKIGSGNWYWCFGSERKREVVRRMDELEKEVGRLKRGCEVVEASLEGEKKKKKKCVEGDGEDEDDEDDEVEREELVRRKGLLEAEITRLKKCQEEEEKGNGKGVEAKKEDVRVWKEETLMWTDNIYILEEYLGKLAGGDREVVEAVKRECYGDEYVEGEGLRELDLE